MDEGKTLERDYVYWEFPSYGGQQAARLGNYKAILKDIKKGNKKIELYNISNDLKEKNDISSEYPEIIKKFEDIFKKEHVKSDINRFGRAIAGGTSMRDFAKTLQNEKPSGTYHHYVSIDTQMLAMLLVEVTGKSVSQNLQEHIWSKINTEYDAYYTLDDAGMEVALGMLSASLRDFAKFGLLYFCLLYTSPSPRD